MRVRPEVQALPAYRPGVEYADLLREAGGRPLARLDSNEAPWPPFPEAVEAMQRAMAELNFYPEISCRRVTQALADCHGVAAERIVVGRSEPMVHRLFAREPHAPPVD